MDITKIDCGVHLLDGDRILLITPEKGIGDVSRNVYRVTKDMNIVWQIQSDRDGPGRILYSSRGTPIQDWPYGCPFSELCRLSSAGGREWVSLDAHAQPPKPKYAQYQDGDIILASRWDSYNYKIDIETGRAEIFEFEK